MNQKQHNALVSLAVTYLRTGDSQVQTHDLQSATKSYWQAISLFRSEGQTTQEIETLEKALSLALTLKDIKNEAASLNDLGVTYRNLKEFQKALDCFEQALQAIRQFTDSDARELASRRESEANILNNLGRAHGAIDQPQLAYECFQQALSIYRLLFGQQQQITLTFFNLANLYRDRCEYGQAIEWYEQAFSFANDHLPVEAAFALLNLGDIFLVTGDYSRAASHYQQARDLNAFIPQCEIAYAWVGQGKAYEELSQYEQATSCYQQGLLVYQQISDSQGEESVNNLLDSVRQKAFYQRLIT
ncbi:MULTISPECIES: tetratricopeptide repeat protein [Cyanophyceae]|uniref:Tetratricopeptide repeat protein n=1 Tax=Leptolyngbya subtilissima DQ-A4 TaxID=2933933 RepID=A0ABV0K8Q2_9CYAN|nr:tetratricopeptide repeat protein [Nodosilinea sp. FACHB-141]MBD2110324.1 tetratricopeptide repeat protein [Nodosilinea sp. FACHB-141]